MKKLIQLLNEYEKQFTDRPNYFWYKDKMLGKYIFCELNGRNIDNQELMIISKEYQFIKWLVENDKIDFNKVNKVYYKKAYYGTDGMYVSYEKFLDEEILLMLLSIQDNPIEFLCSVLK